MFELAYWFYSVGAEPTLYAAMLRKPLWCRGIHAPDRFRFVDGNNAGRNIFEDRFHQCAAPLQLLHRLLQVLREDVDLASAIPELFGHPVE